MQTKSPKRRALADAIADRVQPFRSRTWIDRLSADDQAGVREIRQRFKSGGYGAASAASIARALREEAAASGWHIVSEKELSEWLRK